MKAASLYERNADIRRSRAFSRIADDLGIKVGEHIRRDDETKREQEQVKDLISKSLEYVQPAKLTGEQAREWRRDQEAQAILSGPIGSRIYAGLVDIWAQPKYQDGELVNKRTTEDINKAIMDYYGVSSMMDVIEILERQIDLYADPESLERYDAVSLTIALGLYR